MTVTIELPERMRGDVDERYATEALVATLYTNGKLSGLEARQILGMQRRAFEEMLPRYGFSILVDEDSGGESSAERAARGEAMAAHLEAIAEAGGIAGIEDPVEWQREIRTDRPPPGRGA